LFLYVAIHILFEFQFVDLGILDRNESEFLDDQLSKVECETEALMPREGQIKMLSD